MSTTQLHSVCMPAPTKESWATSAKMSSATIESPIPPARLFKACALEGDTIMSQALPGMLKSSEIIQGDGGPGSIRKITYVEDGELKHAKYKIEKLDKNNLIYAYDLIEGNHHQNMAKDCEKIKVHYESKFEPSSRIQGGSTVKITTYYHTKGGEIEEAHVEPDKKALGLIQAVETYLLANPHVCA